METSAHPVADVISCNVYGGDFTTASSMSQSVIVQGLLTILAFVRIASSAERNTLDSWLAFSGRRQDSHRLREKLVRWARLPAISKALRKCNLMPEEHCGMQVNYSHAKGSEGRTADPVKHLYRPACLILLQVHSKLHFHLRVDSSCLPGLIIACKSQ